MKDGHQVYSVADGLTGTMDEHVTVMLDAILTDTIKMPSESTDPKHSSEDLVVGSENESIYGFN